MLRPILIAILLAALMGCSGDNAEKYIQAGFADFQHQKYDAAIANYEKAIKLRPRDAAAYNMMGLAYRFKYNQSEKPEFKQKEMAAFARAIKIDPKNWVAMINLATDYYDAGDKAKAAPLFKQALALNPHHPEKLAILKMIAEGEAQH